MRTPKTLLLIVAASTACIATSAYAEKVTTADGPLGGADVEVRERDVESVVNGDSLNTRTSGGGDRNEVIGLKFDLTGYTTSELMGVSLNLINYRDNSARQVALYGVAQGTVSGSGTFTTETWSDDLVTVFGDVPGLLLTDSDPSTQSLNLDSLTPLGVLAPINNTAEGSIVTFDDAALTAFIQDYSKSHFVTFILAANEGYTSSGQWRAASKEAASLTSIVGEAGEFAPYLEFSVVPEPTSLALFGLGGLALLLRRKS